MSLQVIMFALSVLLTWHFTRAPFPARAYLITLCAMSIGFIGAHYLGVVSIVNTTTKCGLFAMFFVLLIVTKLITKEEIKEMLAVVLPKNVTNE